MSARQSEAFVIVKTSACSERVSLRFENCLERFFKLCIYGSIGGHKVTKSPQALARTLTDRVP